MKSISQVSNQNAALIIRRRHCWLVQQCCRLSLGLSIAISTAIQLAPAISVLGSAIEFDSARSSAVIAFDPAAIVEARNDYVPGTNPVVAAGPVLGTDINAFLGAGTFYSQGYRGANAVIANIEAGYIWSGHETLTHVQQIPHHPSALGEFDRHATWVGMILGGRRGGTNPGPYQEGMAPDAQLFSGAFATQWNGAAPRPKFQSSERGDFRSVPTNF